MVSKMSRARVFVLGLTLIAGTAVGHATEEPAKEKPTGVLNDTVTWNTDLLKSQFRILESSVEKEKKRIVWVLAPLPRLATDFTPAVLRAVFHDKMGKVIGQVPVEWITGRREAQRVYIAEIDLAYVAQRLGASTKDVASAHLAGLATKD